MILQCDLLNNIHPSTIVCPITTNVKKNVSILRVNLDKGEGGLEKESAIMMDQMRAIDNKRFIKKLGTLSPSRSNRVKENVKIILELGA